MTHPGGGVSRGSAAWIALVVTLSACGGTSREDTSSTSGGGTPNSASGGGGGASAGGHGGVGGNMASGGRAGSGGSVPDSGIILVPNPPPECAEPADPGPCEAAITRYYFDAAAGRCLQFTYGGCQGNGNNFDTLAACEERCIGSGCRCNASGCLATSACPQCPTPAELTSPCYVTMACSGAAADCRCDVPSEGAPGHWYCYNDGR